MHADDFSNMVMYAMLRLGQAIDSVAAAQDARGEPAVVPVRVHQGQCQQGESQQFHIHFHVLCLPDLVHVQLHMALCFIESWLAYCTRQTPMVAGVELHSCQG